MDISNKKWHGKMQKKVLETLEELVMMEASVVGYITIDVEGVQTVISYSKETVTISAGAFKQTVPMSWYLDSDEADMIVGGAVSIGAAVDDIAEGELMTLELSGSTLATVPLGIARRRPPGMRTPTPLISGEDDEDAFETVGLQDQEPAAEHPGLLGGAVQPHPGVPSAAQLVQAACD